MTRSRGVALAALAGVLLLGAVVVSPFLILPLAVPMLSPVLPRPEGVPEGAKAEYSFKSGETWRWERTVPGGCVGWMAERDWADAVVSTDASNCRSGPGVSYFTSSDELVFRGYWPRPAFYGGQPCPVSLSADQIAALRRMLGAANTSRFTGAERAVLRRIDQRLAKADGSALTTDASGWCNDLKPEDYRRRTVERVQTWPGG